MRESFFLSSFTSIFFFELFGFWFWSWDFPKSLRSLLSAWNTMDVTENLLDEWLWQKKVGLKKMLRSPFLCIMCIRVEKTSTNHGRLVPTKWLKKTLQKCSFLKTFNWWCVHILGCAWARASNIHTSKQAYSLARKLDVLWLRHEWIYVLETKLLRTTYYELFTLGCFWNGNTSPSRHRKSIPLVAAQTAGHWCSWLG